MANGERRDSGGGSRPVMAAKPGRVLARTGAPQGGVAAGFRRKAVHSWVVLELPIPVRLTLMG